ncbi:MAG TPA: tyrosine-type recombinase/integrase [Xanthobacteraceae bacterium]|jgi:site-specific recombinase XerD|nr:tyrosine-type recombinase/integrase [Xanthobacteraceae bacterium]
MVNELVPAAENAELIDAAQAVAKFAENSKAANTRRAYAADWRHFTTWCERMNLVPLPAPPATVAIYLGALATNGMKVKTIERRCTAIRHFHKQAGHDNPADHPGVKATLEGIRRTLGTAPAKKAALTADLVAKAIRKIPTDLAGLRDRALILLGFAAALRRSELIGLDHRDIARHPKGLVLTLRRSKTDQAGAGTLKAVPHGHKLKAVAALDAWLAAAAISEGPIFRGVRAGSVFAARLCDHQVARIVKKRAAQVGLDPTLFAGHSLRSGFITSAADAGAELAAIAKHAGHAKIDTTLGYVQVADAFRDHSGKKFL